MLYCSATMQRHLIRILKVISVEIKKLLLIKVKRMGRHYKNTVKVNKFQLVPSFPLRPLLPAPYHLEI